MCGAGVFYFSKKFNKHQLNYSTIKKETVALLLALQYFEVGGLAAGISSTPSSPNRLHFALLLIHSV